MFSCLALRIRSRSPIEKRRKLPITSRVTCHSSKDHHMCVLLRRNRLVTNSRSVRQNEATTKVWSFFNQAHGRSSMSEFNLVLIVLHVPFRLIEMWIRMVTKYHHWNQRIQLISNIRSGSQWISMFTRLMLKHRLISSRHVSYVFFNPGFSD